MFARVNRFKGSPDGLDKSLQIAHEQVVPPLRTTDGSAGIIVLGDRTTGESIGITLWKSEATLRDSEETASRLRTDSAEAAGEEILGVERYEVLFEERW